jgi:hypothetical protein
VVAGAEWCLGAAGALVVDLWDASEPGPGRFLEGSHPKHRKARDGTGRVAGTAVLRGRNAYAIRWFMSMMSSEKNRRMAALVV